VAAQVLLVDVAEASLVQAPRQPLASELGMPSGDREAPHVHQQRHAELPQERHELLAAARGVSDRV
jgi:hypothetical protein